ncbi:MULTISPECIES: hypothetical protein [Legionella]|uniref:hypothetical protein n=1 Tax=Legionella TaxID=445 RepID=UPI001AC06CE0|nr:MULTISPECIES: hypothetical protein [Legionella]MBN9225945.1 hypothetical protein [Legionella steelei]
MTQLDVHPVHEIKPSKVESTQQAITLTAEKEISEPPPLEGDEREEVHSQNPHG